MAAKKSAQYPHQWPDGTWHSIPYAQHQANVGQQVTLDRPPPGSYDPGLDAQQRAAQRGYGQTLEDLVTQGSRATTDWTLSQEDVQRQLGDVERQRGDVERGYGESLSDLLKSRTQGQQDYQTNLQTLARNYQRLGNTQAQRGRQAGLYGQGFAAQAARKRTANEALERQPIDTAFNRFLEGSQLSEQRLGEARQRSLEDVGRSAESVQRGEGQLNLGYQRGQQDIATQGQRAGTELEAYMRDIAEARQAQYGKPLPTVNVPLATRKPGIQPFQPSWMKKRPVRI